MHTIFGLVLLQSLRASATFNSPLNLDNVVSIYKNKHHNDRVNTFRPPEPVFLTNKCPVFTKNNYMHNVNKGRIIVIQNHVHDIRPESCSYLPAMHGMTAVNKPLQEYHRLELSRALHVVALMLPS